MNAACRLACAILLGLPAAAAAGGGVFVRGVDLTTWDRYAVRGATYRDAAGAPVRLPDLLVDHGIDTVRLQVRNVPGFGGAERSARVAGSLRARGLRIWLALHYSGEVAGASRQPKPEAWRDLPPAELAAEVRRYTRETLLTFESSGGRPDFVQLGREIGHGILWDDGRLGPGFESPGNRDRFALLLRAAAEGVRDALGERAEIVVHLETAGDLDASRSFLDELVRRDIPFDRIGLSYYPWWQGTFAQLEATVRALAERYDRPVGIAETAYPWTLEELDEALNEVAQPAQLHPGFEATPEGQAAFLAELLALIGRLPVDRAGGVIWSGPERLAVKGLLTSGENLAAFDGQGEALPLWRGWAAPAADQSPAPVPPGSQDPVPGAP